MKKILQLCSVLFLLSTSAFAGTGDFRGVLVSSDGATYTEMPVVFSANGIIAFGSTPGTMVTVSLANYATIASLSSYATVNSLSSYVTGTSLATTLVSYATTSSVPVIRAGSVSMSAALSKTVTFSSSMPNTNYEVVVTPNGLATSGYAVSKTTTGFILTLPVVVTGTVGYVATGDQ